MLIRSILSSLSLYFIYVLYLIRFKEISFGRWILDCRPPLIRWTTICKDKRNGGLGVKNLSILNKELLCKWS